MFCSVNVASNTNVAAADTSSDYTYDSTLTGSTTKTVCISKDTSGLDAYAWVKTPGESDGRMFASGTYHPCLMNHFSECSDTCPQYVPKISGEFQRSKTCECE